MKKNYSSNKSLGGYEAHANSVPVFHLTRERTPHIARKRNRNRSIDNPQARIERLVFKMDSPRTYLLGRRFRLRPGHNTMGVDVIERNCSIALPENQKDINSREEKRMTICGTVTAIWRNLTTKHPGGFIMDKLRRVKAVMITIQQYWLSNLEPIDLPRPRSFYGKDLFYISMFTDQNPIWRNPRAGQWQIAYQDPSPNPRWRMKQIIEFVDEGDVDRTFQISGCNLEW